MKALLFTDIHSNKSHLERIKRKAVSADILICLGDLTMFQAYMKSFLKELDSIGKTILMLPGNHESESELKSACKDFKNIIYLHKDTYEIQDIMFLAYGSGGFAQNDLSFRAVADKWTKRIKPEKKIVLLTHGPPYGVSVDLISRNHVGNKDYADFIKRTKPVLAACGHLHENFYKIDRIGKTVVLNPGPDGRLFIL